VVIRHVPAEVCLLLDLMLDHEVEPAVDAGRPEKRPDRA
jgi:hypothetical protein